MSSETESPLYWRLSGFAGTFILACEQASRLGKTKRSWSRREKWPSGGSGRGKKAANFNSCNIILYTKMPLIPFYRRQNQTDQHIKFLREKKKNPVEPWREFKQWIINRGEPFETFNLGLSHTKTRN